MKNNKHLQGKYILSLVFIFYTVFGISQTTIKNDTPGNTSIIIPAGITSITVETWGAGGGGGSSNNQTQNGGSGGGGGAYAKGIHTVTPGSTYYYTVGTGGYGGFAYSNVQPGDGTSSWFNAIGANVAPTTNLIGTLAAPGKKGTNNSTANPTNLGLNTSSYGNVTRTSGNNGIKGTSTGGGAGGASAAPTAGLGGAGSSTANGTNGSIPGGGGGGSDDRIAYNAGAGGAGRVAITWTCPNYALTSAATATGPFCNSSSSVVTLNSTSLSSGTYTVTYTLSGATSSTGNLAFMTFDEATETGTFTTSTLNLGTTNITVTNISSTAYCSNLVSSFNTASVTVNPNISASVSIAASATTICFGTNVTFTATPTNGGTTPAYQWRVNGTNVGTNSATYSNSSIANGDVVTCVMTSNASPCLTGSPATSNTVTMTVKLPMTANAGANGTICSTGTANITAGANATNHTNVLWTTSGTGIFVNANSLTTCTYTPSGADSTAGSVTLTLTVSNGSCSNVTSTKTITIIAPPTSNAGTALNTCSISEIINVTAGSTATNQDSILWTSNGTGEFKNSNSLTDCTYKPSPTDISNGSVIITLTATNAGCSVSANKVLTIYSPPTSVAGTTINTCSTSGAVNITTGATATNHTTVTWSSNGTGAFTNANSLTLCTYTPSGDDITAGSIILTLTTSNPSCADATSTKTLVISYPMTAIAGTAITTCSTSGAVNITAGSSATNQSNITWTSNGAGSILNANSLTTCTYNPSPAENTAGSTITITLTSSNAGCTNVTSTKSLSISRTMTAVAGANLATCSTSSPVNIHTGSSATNQTLVTWTTSGTGTFSNANSLTNCTYTPSSEDITAGSVILTLTASNVACSNVISTKTLTISKPMIPSAGSPINTCSTTGTVNITAGSGATNQTNITWTSNGGGTIANANSLALCTYTPTATENTAGSTITLTLTATNPGCSNATSTKSIFISKTMTAVAGTVINTCSTSGAVNITTGSSATNQTLVTWSSNGSGTFTNTNSLTTCTYNPSSADITTGTITLTLTASNAGCPNVISTKSLIISKPMITQAGTDIATCSLTGAINITAGASATNQTGQTWITSGTGSFTNATSLTTCTYTPSAADKLAGSVILTLRTTNAACPIENSNKNLIIYTSPVVSSTTPATRSGIGTVILGASATAGTLYWYSTLTGGSSIGFGSSFLTPSISTTTTFYVEAVNGGICTSTPRIPVIATVLYSEIDVKGNGISIVDGDSSPSATDFTDFGSANLTRTFTVSNSGLGVLNLSSITFTGTNASDFSITTLTNDDIASNNSATFTVTFSPTTAGIKTATLIINNNDIDENPFNFNIQGVGVTQEINIQGNAVSIVDNDLLPTTADWTDYSSTVDIRVFTIQNLGNIPITLGAITFSGLHPTDFVVTRAPNTTIGAYGNTTMEVSFIPNAINSRSATISIVNNDGNENPYDFGLTGFAIIPEINIKGNNQSIFDYDLTPSTSDHTDFSTTTITRTFTIFNDGNRPLTIGAITFSGTNPTEFSVTTPPSSSIGAFDSTTFVVTFSPTATGVRTALINIVNNDATGGENPYSFQLQGTGISREIDIKGNDISIPNFDTSPSTTDGTDFSNIDLFRTYTIRNSGNIPLTVALPTFSGGNSSDFTITTPPSFTVAAFSFTTFQIRFNTAATSGTRSTTVVVGNNDSDENPYYFKIQGTAGIPEIYITNQYSTTIPDGTTIPTAWYRNDFGEISIDGGQILVNFVVHNSGTAAMSIGAGSFTGTNATDFTLITPPTSVIAAGGNSRFQIRFMTTVKGPRTATFSLINNDSDENPYNFNLSATGVQTYFDSDDDGVTDNNDLDDDNDGINDVKEQTDGLLYPLTNIVEYNFLNETFGEGTARGEINVNTPGASCTYCYENGYGSACNISSILDDDEYTVTNKITGTYAADPENIHGNLDWYAGQDHTPSDVNGRMAVFNASFLPGTFYEIKINGLIPNVPISYSFWVLNIMNQTLYPGSILPNITVEFLDINNNFITSFNTGFITRCSKTNTSDNTCVNANWLEFSTSASLGDLTSCIIRFKNNSTGGRGNDIAIDDIKIFQKYIDTDGDGVANIFDLDDENDGIPDVEEAGFKSKSSGLSKMDLTTPVTWVDVNKNGQNDNIDSLITANNLVIPDTDGDGVPNYLDLDSDNDSFYDVDESGIYNGDGDINGDGKGDLLDVDGDGILDLYDNNNSVKGTSVRAFAQDTDVDGIPDCLEIDSNNDGIKDIQTGLYSSLDANNDGKVDGTTDSDKDGILNAIDTSDQVIGSPRDLNRKLQLEFDGRNDYGEGTGVLSGLNGGALMAWIDLDNTYAADGVIIGQTNFQIRVTSLRRFEAVVNGTVSTYITPLNTSRWTHVGATYGGGFLKLFINGVMEKSIPLTGNLNADVSKLTIGKNPASNTNYFKGKIDELRVFNTVLTDDQFQRMIYQEIQNTDSQTRGSVIPRDIGALTFSKVARYYRMDAFNDDVIDDLTTLSLDNDTGMKIYNNKNIYVQQAPVPFVTERTGNFATAVDNPTNHVRGQDATDFDYSIIRVKHNITETSNSRDLAMIVDPGVTIVMNNDSKLQNDWYLKLDGKIGLEGKSQLVQTTNSELDVTSSGTIKRDQQGQSNLYSYNYWCSPTSPVNTTANNLDYTIDGVLKDGTNPLLPVGINWVSGLNGAPTSPISITNRWLYKFDNYSNTYANWVKLMETSTIRVGQGFTMKGSGAVSGSQNLTFVGKPNNGTITTNSVGSNQLLLTGNPYPSSLNINQFINDNINSIDGTIYMWEHYSSNNSHILTKYQGGYATRNLTGGIMASSSNVDYISKLGTPSRGIPNQFIPVGQGFFVTGKPGSGGVITFNNGQRSFQRENDVDELNNPLSNTLFKTTGNTKKTTDIGLVKNENDPVEIEEFKKIRLGFTSNDQYHRQLLLGFIDGKATKELDYGYDAINFDDIPNDVYFLIGENQVVIQGDGSFDSDSSYPLGLKTDTEGKVSFKIDELENFDEDQEVYIYDKVNDSYHDIVNEKFEINMPKGINHTRFSLHFKNNNTLAIDDNSKEDEILVKYFNNQNKLQINNDSINTIVEKVTVYNLLSQNILSIKVENQDQKNIQIPFKNSSTGVYIAKIKTSNGNISKKFIVN